MNSRLGVLFRGHWEECLSHLNKRLSITAPKGSKKAAEVRQPMADFCGVETSTLNGWLYRNQKPTGVALYKLMCFLELNDYHVIEIQRASTIRRNLAELLGYGIITHEVACGIYGYNDPSTIFRYLRGGQNPSKNREQAMWDEWKARRDELERVKDEARKKFRLQIPEDSIQQPLRQTTAPTTQPAKSHPDYAALLHLMEGLSSLIDDYALPTLANGDLHSLQAKGGRIILRLSSQLSAVSSKMIQTDQRNRGDG